MLLEWLKLVRIPGLGPTRIQRILNHFGQPEKMIAASGNEWFNIPGIHKNFVEKILHQRSHSPDAPLIQELDRLTDMGGHMLILGEKNYPFLLSTIHDPPPVLFVRGQLSHLSGENSLAVVGSRRASHFGTQFAHTLANQMASNGLVTVSGMAFGIDTAAHWGALEGNGPTVAVVATGLDICYPPSNIQLQNHIIQQGCVVTEASLGTHPSAFLFPPRNRIISGLCQGVAVVEASKRSGSLITARMALEQNREVFAVPGRAGDPRSQGCNQLLRQGAAQLEDIQDILQTISWPHLKKTDINTHGNFNDFPQKTPEITEIQSILEGGPIHVDELARRSHLTVGKLSRILLQLELLNVVERLPGNRYTLRH